MFVVLSLKNFENLQSVYQQHTVGKLYHGEVTLPVTLLVYLMFCGLIPYFNRDKSLVRPAS